MWRTLTVILALGLPFAFLVPAMADSTAEVDTEADYGARPVPLGDAVRTNGFFAHSVEPGTGIVDTVEIFNFTDSTASFDVYPADMVASGPQGELTATSPDVAVVGPGTWVTLEMGTVQVEPNDSKRVDFFVDVPTGVAPGDYLAALMVEPRLPLGDSNIETRARIGLRLEIEVMGEIDLGVGLAPLSFTRDDGDVRFELSAANTGTVTFAAEGEVVVSNGSGEPVAEVVMQPSGLFVSPGEEIAFHAIWEDPPLFGRYQAEAVLVAVVGDRLPVRFTSDHVTIWLVPWALIVTVLLIVGLVGAALYVSRDRRRSWARRRREERALLRDYRERRRLEESGSDRSRSRTPVGH